MNQVISYLLGESYELWRAQSWPSIEASAHNISPFVSTRQTLARMACTAMLTVVRQHSSSDD